MKSPDFPPTLEPNGVERESPAATEDGKAPEAPTELPRFRPFPSSSDPQPSPIQRLVGHRLFRFAIVVGLHILIFSLVAGWVVFKAVSVEHHYDAKFQMVKIAPPPQGLPAQKPASIGSSSVQVGNNLPIPTLSPIALPTPRVDFNLPSNTSTLLAGAATGRKMPGPGQNNLEAGLGDGLGVQMSQLLFQLPLLSQTGCALIDDHSLIVHLKDENVHTCTVLVRGVVEQSTYVGGVTDGYICAGGTPQTGTFNIYELEVDDPPQTYYLNAGESGISKVFLINYTLTIQIKNGSRLTLYANSIDRAEIPNDQALEVPDTDSRYPLAVKQPYNGQFIQVDAIAVDQNTGGHLLAAALKGPQQARNPDGEGSAPVVPSGDHPAAPVAPMTPEQTPASEKTVVPSTVAGVTNPSTTASPPYGKVKPVDVDLEQNGESNIWIYVGLNGGAPHRYLLDTGSWGFYALYSSKWWPGNPKSLFKTNGFDTELYGNMTYGYGFVPVFSSVRLYNYFNGVQAYQFPEKDYAIAKAFTWYDDYEPQKGVTRPSDSITKAIQSADENDDDKLDNHGIFGAGTCLQFKGSDTLGYANLSNLLAQTPGDGYVITDNGSMGKATLTIGLNDLIRGQFSQFLSLHPNYQSGGFPNTHWPSFGPPVVQITLSRPGHKPIVFHGNFWIDSGSGDSNVRMPGNASQEFDAYIGSNGALTPGTKINVSDPTRTDGLDYSTIIPDAEDAVHGFTGQIAKKDTDEIGIWFGIDFFRHNSVLYDLKNGVMGFSPRRPELDQSVLDSP